MGDIFLKIFNMSVTAGWFVLAVVVLRLLLKKAPRWITCLLWGVIALRLILPFSIESVMSLIPSNETIPENISTYSVPVIESGVPIIDEAVNPVVSEALAPQVDAGTNPVQVILSVASVVWLVGIAVMFAYSIFSYIRLYLKVGASLKFRDNIYYCDDIKSPFILGIIRPRIYIPSGIDKDQMGFVIEHERAHLKRKDHFWKPLGYLLLSVYWFNPAIWIAYILLCRDIESACDEKVIAKMDSDSKKAYSRALVDCSVQRRMILACPLAFGEVGVKGRVKSVLNYKKPAFWIVIVAVIAGIVVSVCFLTNPKEMTEEKNGDRYCAEKIIYQSSATLYDEVSWQYMISDDMHLLFNDYPEVSREGWYDLGKLQEIQLNENNFDKLINQQYNKWYYGYSAEYLRENNLKAYSVYNVYKERTEILLEQKNGKLFIAYKYDDSDVFRWIYRLEDWCFRSPVETYSFVEVPYTKDYFVYQNSQYKNIGVDETDWFYYVWDYGDIEKVVLGFGYCDIPSHPSSGLWNDLGRLEKIQLSESNFVNMLTDEKWEEGYSATNLVENNLNAFYIKDTGYSMFTFLLQQKNGGDLYVAQGDEGSGVIRWIFKLKEARELMDEESEKQENSENRTFFEGTKYVFSLYSLSATIDVEPAYCISDDFLSFSVVGQMELNDFGYTDLGELVDFTLTKENFDNLFPEEGRWFHGFTAESFRESVTRARCQVDYVYGGFTYVLEIGEKTYILTGATYDGVKKVDKIMETTPSNHKP